LSWDKVCCDGEWSAEGGVGGRGGGGGGEAAQHRRPITTQNAMPRQILLKILRIKFHQAPL
jgi:hypothetical protein